MKRRRHQRIDLQHHGIPTKANRVLNVVLVAMILILIRVWHLSVIQYDARVEEARKPQRKTIVEPATRASIRDRFNLPLAINKIEYQAAILYSHIKEIPAFAWEVDPSGKKVKVPRRRQYIKELSQLLSNELDLEAEKIEDLIHAKAVFYPHVPFSIKDDLSEKEYYRLKMLEREWPGICAHHFPKRTYPRGRVASDVIGYMGAISKKEYDAFLYEMRELEQCCSKYEAGEDVELPEGFGSISQVKRRLKDLMERAYAINDYVGKAGIESSFEEDLRGYYGKTCYYSDSRGNYLRELPGSRSALSGQRILLTISAELQEYAEGLLAQNERVRLVRRTPLDGPKKTEVAVKEPWIKGGAIIAMDPHTGEILAMASYPRYDPNDFITSGDPDIDKAKKSRIHRWFESEAYLAGIWDQQHPIERERYDSSKSGFYDEQKFLTWNAYLDFILPFESDLRKGMDGIYTVEQAVKVQNDVSTLMEIFGSNDIYAVMNAVYSQPPHISFKGGSHEDLTRKNIPIEDYRDVKRRLDPFLCFVTNNYDKVLVVDLCRLAVCGERVSKGVLKEIGQHPLGNYRNASAALVGVKKVVKEMTKSLFHDVDFAEWRKSEEKPFLKLKREEEKLKKSYPKPYLDYIEAEEKRQFESFWQSHQWDLILSFLLGKADSNKLLQPYYKHIVSMYNELKQGAYQSLEWRNSYKVVQESIQGLSPSLAIEYLKTMRGYNELDRPLLGTYRGLRQSKKPLEKHLAAAFYPAYGCGYGRSHAYRQSAIQGSIFKLVTAYEALMQQYHKLNRTNLTLRDLNPLIIKDEVHQKGNIQYVGYTDEGVSIPQLYKGGRLPRSLAHAHNGEVDIVRAMGVSSNPYFSLLAGECLDDPNDLNKAARLFSYGEKTGIDIPGEISGRLPDDLLTNKTGLYAMAIGQHSMIVTPLQTAVMLSALSNGGKVLKPQIVALSAGREPVRNADEIICPPMFPYQDSLGIVGIDFPLFVAAGGTDPKSSIVTFDPEIKRKIFIPDVIRQILLQGLRLSTSKSHADSTSSLTRLYKQHPEAIRTFTELKDQLLGKTSTSESVEQIDLDLTEGRGIYTHVWFGGIAFEPPKHFLYKDEFGQPELVVVIYLRYGGYGKEAAPLAAQMVKKWRDIKARDGKIK